MLIRTKGYRSQSQLAAAGVPAGMDLARGLVAWWPLDTKNMETAGVFVGNVAVWSSVSNQLGALTNGPTTTYGKTQSGVAFSGSAQSIFGTVDSPIKTNTVSAAAWIKPGVTSRGDIVNVWNTGGTAPDQFDLLYGLTAGKPQFFISSGSGTANSGVGATAMTVGGIYHVAGTYNGATVAVYLNGVLQSSASSTISLGTGIGRRVTIGDDFSGGAAYTGSAWDVRLWNRGLTAAEIAQLANVSTRSRLQNLARISPRVGGVFTTSNRFFFLKPTFP